MIAVRAFAVRTPASASARTTTSPRRQAISRTADENSIATPEATHSARSRSISGPYPSNGRALRASVPEAHSSPIARALAMAGSAASKPSTNARAATAFSRSAGSPPKRSKKSATLSSRASERAPRKISPAPMKLSSGRRSPSRQIHDSPPASTAAEPAARSRSRDSGAGPCTNSAPSSAGVTRRGIASVHTRPPARSRASINSTRADRRASRCAAASPAAPAPMTIASASTTIV